MDRHSVAQGGLRLILGIVFVVHGAQKLFGWFGGGGVNGTGDFMASIGLNPGVPMGLVSGAGEVIGGILLLLGVLVPVAAVLLTIDMIVAIIFRTSKLGFINGGGVELNLIILAGVAAVFLLGPGAYSLERMLTRRRSSPVEPSARPAELSPSSTPRAT